MVRLIDADDLIDALNSQDLADWLSEQDEYTPASIVEHALETLPTVDAIPIKWLYEQSDNPDRSNVFRNACDSVAIAWIAEAERKEE